MFEGSISVSFCLVGWGRGGVGPFVYGIGFIGDLLVLKGL